MNRQLWRESGLTNTGDMYRALQRQPINPRWMKSLSAIHAPALVTCGLYDRNVGVEFCRDVASAIPGARLAVFSHSAHFPDMEEPEAYAAAIRAFIA